MEVKKMTCLSHTYWNGNGRHQEKLNEMEDANWNCKYTAKSKAIARRYYRYFNDGDMPRGKDFHGLLTIQQIEYRLEKQANEMVLAEYERFQKYLSKEGVEK